MEGGIKAWSGHVAEGIPEAGMAYFSSAHTPEDLIYLSWMLEENTRVFYTRLTEIFEEPQAIELFEKLIAAEENHKKALQTLYGRMEKDEFNPESKAQSGGEKIIEGGMDLSEAVEWAGRKSLKEVFVLLMYLETNSYDRYIKMSRTVRDKESKKIFQVLASEERGHLERLANHLDRLL